MAQDITLMGASYTGVPAVELPKTGGGTASFTDVSDTTATAADVASGMYFYTAAGVRTAGTGSGGGGVTSIYEVTGIAPTDDGRGNLSLSFSVVDEPCEFVMIDEALSYQISSTNVRYPIMWHFVNDGGWKFEYAYGYRTTKYYVYSSAMVTKEVSYSDGVMTITGGDLYLKSSTTYKVIYVVNRPGVAIPTGYAYYNGYLLPKIPVEEDYPYIWIRTNHSSGIFNVVYGKAQWRSRANATLDNWQLECADLATEGAVYYAIADDGSETTWRDRTITYNYFGLTTSYGRKLIWTNSDIKISTTSNILMYAFDAIEA